MNKFIGLFYRTQSNLFTNYLSSPTAVDESRPCKNTDTASSYACSPAAVQESQPPLTPHSTLYVALYLHAPSKTRTLNPRTNRSPPLTLIWSSALLPLRSAELITTSTWPTLDISLCVAFPQLRSRKLLTTIPRTPHITLHVALYLHTPS